MDTKSIVFLVLGGLGLLILVKPDFFGFTAVVPAETPSAAPPAFPLLTRSGAGADKPVSGLATLDWITGKDGIFSPDPSYGGALTAVANDALRIAQGQSILTPPVIPNQQNVPNYSVGGTRPIQSPPPPLFNFANLNVY